MSARVAARHLDNIAAQPAVAADVGAAQLELVVRSIDVELVLAEAVLADHAANDRHRLVTLAPVQVHTPSYLGQKRTGLL